MDHQNKVLLGIAAGSCAALCVSLYALYLTKREREGFRQAADEHHKRAETHRKATEAERVGRTTAERALRQFQQEQQATQGIGMQPIGIVRSCFPNRVGTPRQGLLVAAAKGCIDMHKRIPPESLEDLTAYSHIWVIFVFHENTNANRNWLEQGRTFPAKVHPPQLLGNKVGLFSTRTPHRPNPIGLSVVKLDSVDIANRKVYISGLDLVEGTPVLDIKPYISVYDSQPEATYPAWIESTAQNLREVSFTAEALHTLEQLKRHLRLYQSVDVYLEMLRQLLPLDIRSVRQGRGTATGESTVYFFQLDALDVEFVTLESAIQVVNFKVPPKPEDRLRSRERQAEVSEATSSTAHGASSVVGSQQATSSASSSKRDKSNGRATKATTTTTSVATLSEINDSELETTASTTAEQSSQAEEPESTAGATPNAVAMILPSSDPATETESLST